MPDLAAMGATLRRWREDIRAFVIENFGIEPDAWQAAALDAFASPDPAKRRLSLQACVGPGKTAVLAWCGLHFLGTQGERGEHPKGAAVAITFDNLRDNLFPEFAKWMGRSSYFSAAFTWNQSRIFANDHPETWFLSARSWPKSANADEQGKTLSGLHSKYVLALIDESGAIPLTVLRAAEQALSNCTFGKIVQAGNPISQEGMLYAAASSLRHLWHIIRVTRDPDDPQRSPRIDLEWAKTQIETYGRDNPWVASYILGQFPTQAFNALLTVEEVEAAMHRHLRDDAFSWAQKRIGVDVARFGDDRTVLFPVRVSRLSRRW
jgi:phage terminase large subunit